MRVWTKRLVCCGLVLASGLTTVHALELTSPNGEITLFFDTKDVEGQSHCPAYNLTYRGRTIVGDSRLGMEVNGVLLGENLRIVSHKISHHDSTWKPVYGERSTIRDNYREAAVELRETEAPHRVLHLTFRAYDEGVAFCYTLPRQAGLRDVTLSREHTEFRFLGDHSAWAVYSAQGRYETVPLSRIKPGCERPLTIQIADDVFVALAEARLVDYARMKLSPLDEQPHGLVSSLSSDVKAALPLTTPWRVIMVAASPGQLLENNDIILNLNAPCAIGDTSWIKPGKVIREVTLTTAGGKACVDFAVDHNLQYVEFDAGWYGHEYSEEADARTVTVDPKRSPGPLDLHSVIRYADERGIGIILYVNRRALERQLDEILPLYRKWGIKGVKYGFVNVGSQRWTSWLHEAVRKAAAKQLMVDVHDEYRPTGYSRTYPNLMTQEGIAGDETRPVNSLTLTILFTRMLAGAADNTICYYDERVAQNASHAYQLAKAVCFYSPWQFVYWYDRPRESRQVTRHAGAQLNHVIGDEPELEFFDHVPTVWDDTRVIHGEIGEYAVIARRNGDSWFIGCMNSGKPRTLQVSLDFLNAGRTYAAHIYSDDSAIETRTHVRIDRFLVKRGTILRASVSARGGQAIRVVPATAEDRFPVYR